MGKQTNKEAYQMSEYLIGIKNHLHQIYYQILFSKKS